ncbi:MAG: DUF2752 domain-containing protein [Planctomycetes bacterium]|nr:DUF2752 domain-containing protein [Planctomycetota bacterium]
MSIVRRPLGRLLLATAGILGLTLLVTARNLEPDPRGFGTHEQLGLTPCTFQELTGHVCPLCGGTTAWALLLRGEVMLASIANLGAMLLCVAIVIGAPWMLLVAICGRWLIIQPTLRHLLVLASAWLAVVVLDWLRRLFLGM